MASEQPVGAQRVRGVGVSVFAEMTALANAHGAVNLGQGFPDFEPPAFLTEAAEAALRAGYNQYAPARGLPQLREAVAADYERRHGLAVDAEREVLVTHGATEAIFAAILSLVDPGDEVILFEPYYDSYLPAVQMAGGVARFYTLQPPDWAIDEAALAALFNERTRLILVNTPHNPTGKCFSAGELALIAELCGRYDALAMVDEVYEHLTYEGSAHRPLLAEPGMRQRTVAISSLGKSFSATGWKVGWAIGAPPLVEALLRSHQFITFCANAPLQAAAATALAHAAGSDYYGWLRDFYSDKRGFLLKALRGAGIDPIPPQGTYFIMADISGAGLGDDVAFCRYLTTEVGVAAIPPSAFYSTPGGGEQLARFAFCKSDEALAEAARRLQRLFA
jgi:N-succinyldiaminopimelate aminotransferase